MKKRLLAMLLAFAIVLVSIPFGTMQVIAAEIPEGAPFTALTTDKGGVLGYEDMGTVTYTGYSTYENVPYYHVTIPSGATEVYVTHPSAEDPFADASYGSAYGYYASTEDWTGSGMTYSFEEAEDGYKITLPLSKTGTDWSTGETYELSFVKDEEGNNPYAVAVERNDYSPIAFFTFEYAAEEHTCSFGEWEQTKAPTCTTEGEETRSCECGKTETKPVDATGHSFSNGSCSVCGVADPDYKTELKIPDSMNLESISDATSITEEEWIDFSMWGMSYGAQGYTVTVPSGTENVTLTFKEGGDYPQPYEDYYTGEPTISGCWVMYNADDAAYTGSGAGHACIENNGVHSIVLDVASMVESGKMYGAYNSSNECAYILKFEYAEATDTPGDDNTGDVEPTVPFTAITTDDSTVIAAEKITFVKNVKYNGFQITFPYYHVKVPAGTTYIDVTYPESANATDYAFYADTTNWSGDYFYAGGTGRLPLNEDEMSFVSENGTAPYAVATETSEYRPIAFFTFEYEEGTTPEVPSDEPERKFTQITAGEKVVAESEIEYKGIFKLGDSYSGDDDGYDYIHEVPYYMVTVPLGTEDVDITYTADTKIMIDDPSATVTTARGYRTKIDESADLTASATVYGTAFTNGYTKNSDGTQTVKTNVKDNTVKSDGYRWAITVEEPDAPLQQLHSLHLIIQNTITATTQ